MNAPRLQTELYSVETSELEEILLTCDGAGKDAKKRALEEIKRRQKINTPQFVEALD